MAVGISGRLIVLEGCELVQYVAVAVTGWVLRQVRLRRRLVTQAGFGETCGGGYFRKWTAAEPGRCAVASQIKAAAGVGDDPPTGSAGLWRCIVGAVSRRCPDSQMLGAIERVYASRALRMSRPGPADSRIMRIVASGEHADLCLLDVRLRVTGSSRCRPCQGANVFRGHVIEPSRYKQPSTWR